MEFLNSDEFQLIKRDTRELQKILFTENDVNDWAKIIILYNMYLVYNQIILAYSLFDFLINDKSSFEKQFTKIYAFFFLLCSIKTSYLYFIYNLSKTDYDLSMKMHNNLKNFF
jgi:hypothetical protein